MKMKLRMKRSRVMQLLQIIFGISVLLIGIISLYQLHSLNISSAVKDSSCPSTSTIDRQAITDRVEQALAQLATLQQKLKTTISAIDSKKKTLSPTDLRLFLDEEIAQPLYSVYVELLLIRLPADSLHRDPLVGFFSTEETRKYLTGKETRHGKPNIHGANRTYGSIGHACVLMKSEMEEFMDYEVGSYCKDDWRLAQAMMARGCDPLPRRRCLARAPPRALPPRPLPECLWQLPDASNIRWTNYRCTNFSCLSSRNPNRGFSKCADCFEMEKERRRWVGRSSLKAEFGIAEVMAVKPGEMRIGLDVSVGTGSFAARMREWNVTVASTALNVGAPFSETIALRGLLPLYLTLNQRLPFFDNTLDIVHTGVFLDGWIDLELLDFVLFDWDRVIRPGGLLWIDKFFCEKKDLRDYSLVFLQFGYRKHRWVVSSKSKNEVYLSALLEKPPRTL